MKILIVEDSATQALRLRKILERHGFTVVAAGHGGLALEALASFTPALIITDIQMPEMDGYELCRRLKADPARKDIPIMLLTSLSAPQDIIQGLECGADNFVVKPYEEAFLLSRIETILANLPLRTTSDGGGITIHFAGQRYVITSDRRQILNLLLSTYETAVKTNQELIQAHEDLKAAQAQLIEAEKLQSVGRLAAGVAHEVRNPLAIMEMGLGFLSDQTMPEENHMILAEMKEAVRRANIVITGLMDLSSPREMGMREMSLNEPIERALTTLGADLAQGGVIVERNLAPNLPRARLDPAKIEQVFINLFTNALHAMPQGGTLVVRTHEREAVGEEVAFEAGGRSGARFREGERVVVAEVRDSGDGIAPENLPKLFEPFFTTKPTGQGMGLGLTVARKIVEVHDGRIAVHNHEGGGAAVTLTFKTT